MSDHDRLSAGRVSTLGTPPAHERPMTGNPAQPSPPSPWHSSTTTEGYKRQMQMMGSAFNREMDSTTYDAYLFAVKGYHDGQLALAVRDILTNEEFFPTPKKLMDYLAKYRTAYQRYRDETDRLTESWLRGGMLPINWTGELYAYHCRRLLVPPKDGWREFYRDEVAALRAEGFGPGLTVAQWEEAQRDAALKMG